MNSAKGTEAGLKTLTIHADRFAPVLLCPRMRGRYAPVHVGQEVDQIWLTPTPGDPAARVVVDGVTVDAGQPYGPIRLQPGRNAVTLEVTAEDGVTRCVFTPRLYRDYPGPAWRQVSGTSPWLPRDSAGELVFDGRMWLLGGYTPEPARDVWCSRDGATWTHTGEVSASRSGIDIPMTWVFDGRMWVADMDGLLFASVDGADWSLVTDQAPWRGRGAAGAATFDGRMWVMGGAAGGRFLNDVWSSGDGVHWTRELETAPWSARMIHHTPLVMDGRMWLIGGAAMGDYYPFRTYQDVWCTEDGRHWKKVLDEAPWRGRIWGSTAVYRDRLWVLGGFRSEPAWENLGDVWYSVDGVQWNELSCPATCRHSGSANAPVVVDHSRWELRHEMSVYDHDGKLWVVGGMVWPLMNDVWSLDIAGLTFVTQPVVEDFAGTRYDYRARADFNRSRGRLQYRLVDSPAWLSVDSGTGLVEGVSPGPGDVTVTVEARDAAGETACQRYTLHILPAG